MGSMRYLNVVLTVIAVLLALNLATGGFSERSTPEASRAYAVGIPNAGQQRSDMIDQLKKLNVTTSRIEALLSSGNLRVRVEAPRNEEAGR